MPRRDELLGPLPDRELAEPRPDGADGDGDGDEDLADQDLAEPEGDDDEGPRRPVTNGDLARIFHEIGDILEVKGEIVFKTVAYHRAADAIARTPFDVGAAYGAGDRRPIPGVGTAIARQDRRDRDDRADGLLRQAARGDPGHARRPAADPGRRAQDRPHRLGGPRRHEPRGDEGGRRGGPAPRAEGHLREHRAADPRGHREARDAAPPPAHPPRPGHRRRPRRPRSRPSRA